MVGSEVRRIANTVDKMEKHVHYVGNWRYYIIFYVCHRYSTIGPVVEQMWTISMEGCWWIFP